MTAGAGPHLHLLLSVPVGPLPLLSLRLPPLPLLPPPGQLAVRHRLERHVGPGAAAVLASVPVPQEDGALTAVALGVLQFRLGAGRPRGWRTLPTLLLLIRYLPRRLPSASSLIARHARHDGRRQGLRGRRLAGRQSQRPRAARWGGATGRHRLGHR